MSTTTAPQMEERVVEITPATPAEKDGSTQASNKPSSPLLPSAFFADGGKAFTAWRCTPAQDLIATFPDNRLRLWSGQGHYELERAVVASGARYTKDDLSFWNKGDIALVESDNGRLECQQDAQRKTWDRRQHPDTIFYAKGNEPGWALRLDRQTPRLSWVTDYGKRTLVLPYKVDNVVNGQHASMTLVSQDPAQPLTVELEARACFDSMSGKPFPVRVTITSDTQKLLGCGQGIEER
ncbi:MliC family protein [Halomonas sp. GXIMD04776]|uniref:MliC family protein n=1 Tax=Halomonas sp. GXIMD04776 TaxID=3415605 RepID=UPI003C9C060A